MKNKWYEVFGAGLLSVSAMYLCTALVVTGCSGDNSSVTGGDVAENSEVVESGDNEEVESSDVEEISKTEKDSKAEKSSDEKESEDKESSKAEESSKTEDGESANSEKKEPVESEEESVDAQEKLTTPEGEESAEPEELAKPDNAESEESAEPEEPNNDTESNESVEPDVSKKVARHTREWYRLRDTVSYFITDEIHLVENGLEKLEKDQYSIIDRCKWERELEDCSMEESAFHAAYNDNEDVMHKLTDAGILWDGSEWEGWNPIENGESSVVLDTVLSAWSNGRIYVHAVYRVSYYLDSDPNTEHGFTLDVPVMYMRVD